MGNSNKGGAYTKSKAKQKFLTSTDLNPSCKCERDTDPRVANATAQFIKYENETLRLESWLVLITKLF